ncbi:MAG: hypothetical protein KBD46_01070 [Candidatus Levybacteria bacterium]|nr:hypothetical protein [Candidatus Levybacteria bacterium]
MDNNKAPLLHKFDNGRKSSSSKVFMMLAVAIVLGVVTGYFLSGTSSAINSSGVTKTGEITSVQKGDIIGSDDTKTFSDTAEGTLKSGGIEGEGQFHLVRPGGESQYVYLVSSIVDLSKFENRKIKVWGSTQTAQKAGWLMDVGKVEVLQ